MRPKLVLQATHLNETDFLCQSYFKKKNWPNARKSYSTFSDSKCIFLIFRSYLNFLTEELVNPNK